MKAVLKMKYSGGGFPSVLLLFDTSPGPAITRSPLCIKKDGSNRGFAASRKEGECLDARSGEGQCKRQPEVLGRGWPQALVQPWLEGRCSLLCTCAVALFPAVLSHAAHQRQLLALAHTKCTRWSLPHTLAVQSSGALHRTLQLFPVLA